MIRKASADISMLSPDWATATQTIDFELFRTDLSETGTFDLRAIHSTAMGKLLDAVPIPALLVSDQSHVIFCNAASARLDAQGPPTVGSSFLDFLPRLQDDDRSNALATKAEAIFSKALDTRKPQQTEAILKFGNTTRWFRLHLHSVRMVERHVLVILEDLTHEKVQLRATAREERRLRNTVSALRRRVNELTAELDAAKDKLKHCEQSHPDYLQLLSGTGDSFTKDM